MSVLERFWGGVLSLLPCVICARFVESGEEPSQHHVAEGSGIRSEYAKAQLCHSHHQGPRGLHGMGPKAFLAEYRPPGDSEFGLLVWTIEDLAKLLRFKFPTLGRRAR